MAVIQSYLAAYNAVSFGLWSYILYTSVSTIYHHLQQPGFLVQLSNLYKYYIATSPSGFPHSFLVYTQVFNSVFEISHSLSGLVNSPLGTVLFQSLARELIVVGICWYVPQSPGNYHFLAFSGIYIAWSLSEIVRYGFYVYKLITPNIPRWLTWLRYSAFLVLYPLGLFSEFTVVYLTLNSVSGFYYYFLVFALTSYVPGFLKLYGYMLQQRTKVLHPKKKLA